MSEAGVAARVNSYDEYGIPAIGNTGRFQYTGQAWLGELGMYYYKARIYSPTMGRFLQADPIGYEGGMNIYAYLGNDPVNGTDPTGTHGRGTGWTNQQWQRYRTAQNLIAGRLQAKLSNLNRALERGGAALESERGRFERVFGEGSGTPENMRGMATTIGNMVTALRDDGSNGYFANAKPAADFSSRTTFARADIGGRTMNVNVDHSALNNPDAAGWGIGHESGHNVGLDDAAVGGLRAYRFSGIPAERAAFDSLRTTNPAAALRNPDHVLTYGVE